MSERARVKPLFGIGAVTMLTVLLVLCLTLFSILALGFAQADLRLSKKNAEAIASYYTAENTAYTLMSFALELWPDGVDHKSADMLRSALGDAMPGIGVDAKERDKGVQISASIPVQDESYLRVDLLLGPGAGISRWDILQWQLIPPAQDESDIAFLPVLILPQ